MASVRDVCISVKYLYPSLDYLHAWLWNSWDTLENIVTCLLCLKSAENIVFVIFKTCEYKLKLQKWCFLVLRFSLSEKRKKCVIYKISFLPKTSLFSNWYKSYFISIRNKRKIKMLFIIKMYYFTFFTIFIQFVHLRKTQITQFFLFLTFLEITFFIIYFKNNVIYL